MSDTGIKPTHRHVKRGTEYQHIGTARVQTDVPLQDMDRVEVYLGRGDDDLWARRQVEFHDGRFEPVPATPSHATDTAGPKPVAWIEKIALDLLESNPSGERLTCKAWNYQATNTAKPLYTADALSALRAENERLLKQNDNFAHSNQVLRCDLKEAEAERDRLQAILDAQPAPDAVAEAAKVLLAQPKKADSPFAEAFFIACAYLEDDPCGIETTNEIIETFLKTLAGEND